jgi:hypothetical protein
MIHSDPDTLTAFLTGMLNIRPAGWTRGRNHRKRLLRFLPLPLPPLKPSAAVIRDEEPRNRWRFLSLLPGDKIYCLPSNRA